MLKKMLLALSTAAAGLGFSGAALADPPYWAPAHGWRAKHHGHHYGHHYAPAPVYVAPAQVVYRPHVVYAQPPVVYYSQPAPVYQQPAPVYYGVPGVSIRLNFPL